MNDKFYHLQRRWPVCPPARWRDQIESETGVPLKEAEHQAQGQGCALLFQKMVFRCLSLSRKTIRECHWPVVLPQFFCFLLGQRSCVGCFLSFFHFFHSNSTKNKKKMISFSDKPVWCSKNTYMCILTYLSISVSIPAPPLHINNYHALFLLNVSLISRKIKSL